ncbi:uncharacterized protein EAF01_010243 [Botrytis porri]|uniref:Uncharacterized protein n=1 Tax=Botrytis porri TaxID=87229 RepID=A0A4Z1KER2_9HELO|nr:uncharacterized protein EAF01_010243 [Botrytis porri]KAF7892163.1 hypothetical protein EAF01_010243 [Botrytis porri]TGO84547.1 hypothetical protein BPOR_0492g00020 [Botrytis porri]
MKSWFDKWVNSTTSFLREQLGSLIGLESHILPGKFFLLGGASNFSLLHKGIKEFLHVTIPQDLDIVDLGTCNWLAFIILESRYQYLTMNSAMIVSYGAMLQALKPTNSFTKSHHWIGIRKEEPYRKRIHVSPLDKDDILAKSNGAGESKYDQAKTIQWLVKPMLATLLILFSSPAFIFMEEIFDEVGLVEDPCAADMEDGAGKQGWSFESQIPADAKVYNFEWDSYLDKEDSLFYIKQIPSLKSYYTINWAILTEITGIGMDIWFLFHSDGRTMSKTDKTQSLRWEEIQKIPFGDLVNVVQKEYDDDLKGEDGRKDQA